MDSFPHRSPVRRFALGLVAAAALALPATASATEECANLSECTSVPASSWLVVDSASQDGPGLAGTTFFCPQIGGRDQLGLGSDFLMSGNASPFKLWVGRLLPPGQGLSGGGDAHFTVVNEDSDGAAVKPIIGCVPAPPLGVAAGAESEGDVRLREKRLHPSDRATYAHRCQGGERLDNGFPGVLFHTEEPPSAREIAGVKVAHHVGKRRVKVRVRTGKAVGDDERVTLQITAFCSSQG